MSEQTSVHAYLESALGGTLIAQMAFAREISVEALLVPNSIAAESLRSELSELGIDPAALARQSLSALATVFIAPANADHITTELTKLLWNVLGDPDSGSPPAIYRKAGCAMHLAFIGLISPDLMDTFIDSLSKT